MIFDYYDIVKPSKQQNRKTTTYYLSVKNAQISFFAFPDIWMSSGNCSVFLWFIIFPKEKIKRD